MSIDAYKGLHAKFNGYMYELNQDANLVIKFSKSMLYFCGFILPLHYFRMKHWKACCREQAFFCSTTFKSGTMFYNVLLIFRHIIYE